MSRFSARTALLRFRRPRHRNLRPSPGSMRRCLIRHHNAAAGLVGSVEETSLEDFEGLFRVNVTGMFLVTRGAVPLIRAARGSIINICEWRGSADRRRVDLRLTC